MSASTATSASIAAASAGTAEGCRFPVRREKPGIFSVRPRPRRPKHSKNNGLLENSRDGEQGIFAPRTGNGSPEPGIFAPRTGNGSPEPGIYRELAGSWEHATSTQAKLQ